jgi:tRNA 2-thiouridine synthesizing protein B
MQIMGPLHTVNKTPLASDALASCLRHLTEGSAVLLIEDGVYAALATVASPLADIVAAHPVYALAPDLAARGLADRPLLAGIKVVDYEGFVDLAAAHASVVSWF